MALASTFKKLPAGARAFQDTTNSFHGIPDLNFRRKQNRFAAFILRPSEPRKIVQSDEMRKLQFNRSGSSPAAREQRERQQKRDAKIFKHQAKTGYSFLRVYVTR